MNRIEFHKKKSFWHKLGKGIAKGAETTGKGFVGVGKGIGKGFEAEGQTIAATGLAIGGQEKAAKKMINKAGSNYVKGAKGELSGGLNVVTGAMDTTGVSYAMDKYSEGTVKMCKAMKAKGKGVTKLCSEVLQNIPFAMLAVASGGTSAIAEGAAAGAKVAEGAELAEATEAAKAAESVEAVEGAEGAETTKEAEAVEKEVTGHDPANPDSSLHHIKEEGGDVVTKKPTLSESYSKFAKENPRSVAGLKAFAAGMGVDYASDAAIDAYIKHLKNNIKTQSKTETEQKEKLDKLKKIKEDAKSKARLITWFLLFLSVILILGIIYLVKKV